VNKTCVISAVDDELQTIKTYLLNAAKKQGMSQETEVTALADGAKIAGQSYLLCNPIAKVGVPLDWFHIGKKFQNVKNALGEVFEKSLDNVKWKVWHGQVDEALRKLNYSRQI